LKPSLSARRCVVSEKKASGAMEEADADCSTDQRPRSEREASTVAVEESAEEEVTGEPKKAEST
jgi:hypothetical protein